MEDLQEVTNVGNIQAMHSVTKMPIMKPICKEILKGNNPFKESDRPAFLKPVMSLILQDKFSKKVLIDLLTGKFGLSLESSENEYRIIALALIETGAIVEVGDTLKIKGKE